MPEMLTERQEQLLQLVVENYIDTATPVGSTFLVERAGLSVSGATVRNELRALEESGHLTHPHTSAGRIPTEDGYRYYVRHLMKPDVLTGGVRSSLSRALKKEADKTRRVKIMGRITAQVTHNAVIIVWNRESVYYTGMSHLFAQPEFRESAQVLHVGDLFDRTEEHIADVFDCLQGDAPTVLIGRDNPLGSGSSIVAVRTGKESLFSVVGPLRMKYRETVSLIQFIHTSV